MKNLEDIALPNLVRQIMYFKTQKNKLQQIKVEIGGDINSTDGTEPSHQEIAKRETSFPAFAWQSSIILKSNEFLK